jgi:hypothetical protein
LEKTMEVVESGRTTMKGTSKLRNIPLFSLVDHLNSQTRNMKIGFRGMLMEEEDVVIVNWVLTMQGVKLFVNI